MKRLTIGSVISVTFVLTVSIWNGACSSGATATSGSSTSCTVTENTTEGAASALGCPLLTRDTTSCQASRVAQGLSGFWLKFSCRVTLTKSGTDVIITSDTQPDYKSPYFETTSACYEAGFPTGRYANPNTLSSGTMTMTVPYTPGVPATTAGTAMSLGVVGVAVNGVPIFSNAAAPMDNIYDEVETFDKCQGHPAGTKYHYHIEPSTASEQDANFIGVMRDGYPIYGRYDSGSVTPVLDQATGPGALVAGGHNGTTVDSTITNVYHYHVNFQTDGTDSAYFITSGYYMGTAGACTGCN